jgi:hypothetical protein
MKKRSISFGALILIFLSFSAIAQKQLLLLKGGTILHRFYPGDDMYIKVKGNQDRIHSYVNNILSDAVVLNQDTIPFHTIERTYFYESAQMNSAGSKLLAAGILLCLGDYINQVAIQKNDFEIGRGVILVSATLITAGSLMLIKKKSQLLSHKYRLMMVKAGDPLYR